MADRNDTCPWNPDVFGVDVTKPGAQAYSDSVFAQAAAWGKAKAGPRTAFGQTPAGTVTKT